MQLSLKPKSPSLKEITRKWVRNLRLCKGVSPRALKNVLNFGDLGPIYREWNAYKISNDE